MRIMEFQDFACSVSGHIRGGKGMYKRLKVQ